MSTFLARLLANPVRRARRTLLALALGAVALPAQAITVTYNWVPGVGQFGSGSLTISDPGITDPLNFSGIPAGALTALSYTWNNGVSINLASVATNTAVSWQACGGYLLNSFTLSGSVPVQFGLSNPAGQCVPNWPTPGNTFIQPGTASNNLQGNGIYPSEVNAGTWQFGAVVPVPAAAWLAGSALLVLAGLRRRAPAA